jgi:hypothetical protein
MQYYDLVDISCRDNQYWFRIRNASGKVAFDSRRYGLSDGGVYSSRELAAVSAVDFLFRNRIAYDAMDNMNMIHANIVSKYKSIIDYCSGKLKEIASDEENESFNNRDRTVPALKSYVDTYAKDGGEMDMMIKEVEKDVGDDKNNDNLVKLKELKSQMQDILQYISSNYKRWMQSENTTEKSEPMQFETPKAAGWIGFIKTSNTKNIDFLPELASFYVDRACGAIGMTDPKILGMIPSMTGYDVHVISDDKRVVVHVGENALFRGITKCRETSPFSYSHYMDVMIPSLLAVGHMQPLDVDDIILLSSKMMSKGPDSFDAISGDGKTRKVVTFSAVGGKETKSSSYTVKITDPVTKIASYQQEINDVIKDNVERLKGASLVKVIKPGSEYEGMAGKIDQDRMEFYNTYVEFPVRIEMDNGLITDVWMTDDDVEIFME